MEALVLASMLTCADGAWILEGIYSSELLTSVQQTEIAVEILEVMPDDCLEEQYNPTGRK